MNRNIVIEFRAEERVANEIEESGVWYRRSVTVSSSNSEEIAGYVKSIAGDLVDAISASTSIISPTYMVVYYGVWMSWQDNDSLFCARGMTFAASKSKQIRAAEVNARWMVDIARCELESMPL